MSQPPMRKKAVKFPCGNCNQTTSGCAALMCNICELWHHTECIPGVTEESHKMMLSMKESIGYAFFLCPKCEKVHKKTWQAVNQLGKRVDAVEKKLDDLEEQLKKITENTERAIKEVKSAEKKSSASSEELKTTVMSEIQEQENRKTNLVIYNLQESTSDVPDDRKEHDTTKIREMLGTIGIEEIEADNIMSLRRLGQRSVTAAPESTNTGQLSAAPAAKKPRPVLLSLKTPQHQRDVLLNARKLAKTPLKHISVCPDLTKNQQKEDKVLGNEVIKLNSEKPHDDKGPFLWKVVGLAGQPSRRKVKIYEMNPIRTH